MKKQTMQQKRRRLLEDSSQLKEHFKMYKVGRIWLFAGLLTVSLGAGIALGDQQDVHAATDATPTSQQATVPAAQTSLPATNTANSDVQANDANQAGMKADTNGQPATDTATTDPAADANNANTNVNTDNNVNKDTKTTNNASTKTANVNATPTSTGETPAADNTAAAPKTDATHAAVTNDVQTTDLGNVDNESTIDQAKAAAAKAYQATGKPQAVVATSGTEEPAPVEATHVTVQNTTKTYDGKTDTPANYAVELSDNLTAPQGWYVTDTINQYLVDPTDLNLSQVGQNVGSYDITLSATGLQKLNAVAANQQKNLTVSAADVTAGKLTITKAPVPTGTVAILAAAKPYDNDATTDPTSYNVQLDAGIVAPNDWTKNTDGTYKVNVASGDLDTAITSQTAGDYQVTLSNAGLQKLNALNANYDITADKVTSGGFQIQDNTKLNIGVAGIAPNAVLPTTLTVGVSRTETVPTDWTVNYNNIAQDSEVYNVPISYFDISAVDNTKIGTYTVNLTTAALNNLNAANPDKQLAVTNIQAGKVFVTNDTSLPVRDLSNFGGGLASLNEIVNKEGDNKANPVFSNGAGFDMSLSFFGTTSEKQNNFTNIVIVPAGLTIATATSNSVDGKTTTVYTKADDPATAIANQVQPQLEQAVTNGLAYTDFKVTQLNNYKGRQAFAVQFGSVDYTHYQGAYNISVMIDPDVTNVTNGHWGNQPDANDNAILYATDTPTFTQGSYKLNYGGDYTNNDQVATALGLTNAVTLKESYANTATNPYAYLWGGKFTIVHIPVKDTYNLTDVNGNQVANPVTIQGQVGDGYNALSVVPTTIKDTDGKVQYVLDPSSLVTDQTFKATPQTLDGTEKVAEGQTYTVKYKHVIDTAIAANQVQVQNQAQTWNNSKPDAYTVSVPAGYAVPETWTKNTDGTYTITTASRDIDSTAVGTAVGQYSVTLSKQGIAKLAMLNPDYLFDNKIANAGTLTITPLNIPVNVEDTAGNQLAPQQNVQLGEAKTESGVNVAVDGYPTDQLAQITFNYATTGNKGVKKATYIIDKQGNTFAEITTYTDGSQPSTLYVLAAGLGGTKAGDAVANLYNKDIDQNRNPTTSLIKFGQTPKITADQAGTFASLASVDVVYYQKATADVDYVDDDNGQGQILNSPVTINGFVGDNVTYTVAVPDGYLPVAPITDGSKMTTTLTEDGSDNLVVHLTHKHTASTVVGTRDIHFKVASNNGIGGIDDSNLPKTITQKVIWNVDKDDVTEKYTATPQNDFADIPVQPITVNTTDGTINSTTTYTPQFDTVKGITLTPLTDLDANDITALGTPVSDTFYYYAARTQVPTDAPATDNDNFYDYTQPGQTTDGIHVYSKGQVPTDAPSVTPDDYYDYTQPGEPGDGIQSRTQVPTDAPSVTTDDYYDYTQPGVPGPGIHVYTDNTQPGGTDTTTQTTDNDTTTPTTPVTTPTGDDTDTTTTTTDNNTTVPGTNPTGNTTDTTDTTTTTTDNNRVVPTKNGQVVTSTNRGTAVNGAYANATTNRAQQLGTQQLGDVTGVETGNVTGSSQGNAANAQTAKLPQTNEQNTSVWAMLGLGLMSVLSLFGLAKGKKREEDK